MNWDTAILCIFYYQKNSFQENGITNNNRTTFKIMICVTKFREVDSLPLEKRVDTVVCGVHISFLLWVWLNLCWVWLGAAGRGIFHLGPHPLESLVQAENSVPFTPCSPCCAVLNGLRWPSSFDFRLRCPYKWTFPFALHPADQRRNLVQVTNQRFCPLLNFGNLYPTHRSIFPQYHSPQKKKP